MIKVVFFAQLREQLGCCEVHVSADNQTVASVRNKLVNEHAEWKDYLLSDNLLISINHTMVKATAHVHSGDELAFFPPVTGG